MFSDVHILSLRTASWTQVYPCGDEMPPRRGHSAALHEPTGRIVIFGGVGPAHGSRDTDDDEEEAGGFLGDTWILHTKLGHYQWDKPETTGAPPTLAAATARSFRRI